MSALPPHPLHQSMMRPISPGASSLSSDSAARKIAPNAVEAPNCPIAWGAWLRKYQNGSWCEHVAPEPSVVPKNAPPNSTNSSAVADLNHPTLTGPADPSASVPIPSSHTRTPSAKLCQPFKLSKAYRYVKLDSDSTIESMEFYKKNGWLAAPPLPRRQHRRVAEALRRHGLTSAQEREALMLYIKHAKAVFKCQYASFMVESPDEAYMLILAQQGGDSTVHMVPRSVTLCSHAMLLPEDEVLVVNNTNNDWRFRSCPSTLAGTVTNAHGKPMNFYASAPLFLSYSLHGIEGRVQVGRLCIMDEKPREDFGEADAELLYAIGRMSGDALEKEFQSAKNAKAAEMQQRTGYLIRSVEETQLHAQHRHFNSFKSSSEDSADGFNRYSLVVFERACKEMKDCLGAAAVAAFDVGNFRFRRSSTKSVSPRNSTAVSRAPLPAWQHLDASDLNDPITPPSESISSPTIIDPDSPMISPRMSRNLSTNQAGTRLDVIDLREGSPPPSLISFSGPDECRPHLPQDIERLKINFAGPLAQMAADTNMNIRCKFYRRQTDSSISSDDEDDDEFASSSRDVKDPWADILPLDNRISSYAVCVSYNRAKARPGIMFLIMFTDQVCFDQQETYFVESTTQISLGSLLRQKLSEVDFFQAEFLRHVQHNLRTPLHGALGAVEYLRAAINNGDDQDALKIDLSADGVLATLLESISLSGLTLNSYIDDLLSFQNLSGLKTGITPSPKRASTDIVKVVESVADEEWEFAQRLDLQSRNLEIDSFQAHDGPLSGVELIIKAASDVRECEWIVDVKSLQDVVRKVVSNAIRFTQQGYVEITIRTAAPGALDQAEIDLSDGYAAIEIEVADTGVGMTKDFCTNQLTRPFSKGDSFRDGIGLGMTIVSSTLQKYGGKLLVASELNLGTRVTMCIPLQRGAAQYGRNGSASSTLPPRVAVSKMAYYGFETRGLRRLANAICHHFSRTEGIELTHNYAEADCIVLPERAASMVDEGDQPLLSQIKPSARFVVISSSHLIKAKGVEKLDGRALLPLPMPHGPSSLRLMETFLSEEDPLVIHMANQVRMNSQHRVSVTELGILNDTRRASGHRHTASDASRTLGGDASRATNGELQISIPQATDGSKVNGVSSQLKHVQEETLQPTKKAPSKIGTSGLPLGKDEFRVLIVEDNPINMKLLTTLCKRLDIRFEEAHDGAEAVAKFISFRPSVVLLDISLPIQDGFEACSQMRAHNYPSFIVAVTALSSEEDKARGIEVCGMDAWMTKPVSPRQLKGDLEVWRKEFEKKKGLV
ncbi:related to SLN1 - histidine kinase osmosensor that regulates a MAP kinase cascade [Melanopsichium pennsylvanicum]|uniref:histidine kinase n=2 Tax=Melanopsichium pennsylvanicum TaxID=63383 RepID=A0AAJ4XTH4_9BASI|nr:sensor histidine kinase response regulator [Melanopsichium pennsylvanicum 4]SNX87657.1 related to SLN1 - histidine kinase osmosensor that regulates a MAP kinase cascade [Melanopsichium pennsylvanicum]